MFSSIVKCSWNQPVLSNEGKVSWSAKQLEPLSSPWNSCHGFKRISSKSHKEWVCENHFLVIEDTVKPLYYCAHYFLSTERFNSNSNYYWVLCSRCYLDHLL